jgi:hypothetical protein
VPGKLAMTDFCEKPLWVTVVTLAPVAELALASWRVSSGSETFQSQGDLESYAGESALNPGGCGNTGCGFVVTSVVRGELGHVCLALALGDFAHKRDNLGARSSCDGVYGRTG